jgi:hypothetical protein
MKCPHCEYEQDDVIKGDFYALPINVEREEKEQYHRSIQRKGVFACPSCSKMFIDLEGW